MANVDIRIGKKNAAFFAANPTLILKDGQFIFNSDTSELFIGDGTTQLSSLVAINGAVGGSGFVPYTGATQDTDLGNYSLNAKSLHVKGTAGSGHLGLKHQSSNITASASESSIGANSLGNPIWKNDGNPIENILLQSNITQTITSGVTDKAPSEDKMFNALNLKRSTTSEMLLMTCFATGINLADATTYYFGSLINSAPLTALNWNRFTFPNNYTITKVILTVFQNAGGSNENVSLYLRYNNTTDYTITTTLDLTTPSNTSKTFTFTLDSPISVVSGGDYEFKIVTPTWATNPALSRFFITLYGY
jgi:hypothetical protein